MLRFYEFSQNNSGGSFYVNDKVCHRLFIEAKDAKEANLIAQSLGIYFNGCASGMDCDCCGDRWSEQWSDDYFFNLEEINENGYEVREYGSHNGAKDRWYDKYGNYHIVKEPEFSDGKYSGRIVFKGFEEYAQFMADEYGLTSPDVRIFYKNGEVKDIFSKKVEGNKNNGSKKK